MCVAALLFVPFPSSTILQITLTWCLESCTYLHLLSFLDPQTSEGLPAGSATMTQREITPSEFDLIVVGTGLQESLLAA